MHLHRKTMFNLLLNQIKHNSKPIISFSIFRIMALLRKASSKPHLQLSSEDFTASIDQKLSIIAALKSEVYSLSENQQKYDRVQEELAKARSKYETLLRDHQTCVLNNQQRLELSARNVFELKVQAEHLDGELRLKSQNLKEAKFNTQQLVDFEGKKQDEATEKAIMHQELRSLGEVGRMEEERLRLQIGQLREQVDKGRCQNGLIRTQNDNITEKCYKTQSYIRNLLREETNLNENLSSIEDEKARLNTCIAELDTAVSINNCEVSNKRNDCEDLQFQIASKELEKKKLENEIREKVKKLSYEKEKWKTMCEDWQQKRYDASRTEGLVQQTSSQIAFIISKNNEITDVNEQLRDDLKVCQRHLENVGRINRSLDTEVQGLQTTNAKAIERLKLPFTNRASPPLNAKWGVSSRETNYETGDFDKWSK